MLKQVKKEQVPYANNVSGFTDKELYRDFTSVEDATIWGETKYSDWAKKHNVIFNSSQHYGNSIMRLDDPVARYFGFRYLDINRYLRGTSVNQNDADKLDEATYALKRDITLLTAAILSAPLIDKKIILYRQVDEIVFNKLMAEGNYIESGFMSTSLVKSQCARHCGDRHYMLRLYVNNEYPIHSIYANLIAQRNELEVLLPPDLQLILISQPYQDEQTDKIICDVALFNRRPDVDYNYQVMDKRCRLLN